MENVKLGIVGLGNIGLSHAQCILNNSIKGLELVAGCDTDADRLSALTAQHPRLTGYGDYPELLAHKGLDAVLVATPHRLHAQMAVAGLEKGLHVLVEKPADVSVSRAQAMNRAAQASGKVFGIMFNQRTNPLFRRARQLVQGGTLGQLKRSVWIVTNWYRTQSYYDSGDWRGTWSGEGGGVLLNQAPHNLDLWQWICGLPASVTAFCGVGKYHRIDVEDDVTILARYANGATGTFITSTGEYPGTNRLEISLTKGKLVLENGVLKLWQLKKDERQVCFSSAKGFEHVEYEYSEILPEEPETAHKGILQNFTNAILFGEELIAPGVEGIRALSISNAAYLSSWRGNVEIALPVDGEAFDRELARQVDRVRSVAPAPEAPAAGYKERWQVRW